MGSVIPRCILPDRHAQHRGTGASLAIEPHERFRGGDGESWSPGRTDVETQMDVPGRRPSCGRFSLPRDRPGRVHGDPLGRSVIEARGKGGWRYRDMPESRMRSAAPRGPIARLPRRGERCG